MTYTSSDWLKSTSQEIYCSSLLKTAVRKRAKIKPFCPFFTWSYPGSSFKLILFRKDDYKRVDKCTSCEHCSEPWVLYFSILSWCLPLREFFWERKWRPSDVEVWFKICYQITWVCEGNEAKREICLPSSLMSTDRILPSTPENQRKLLWEKNRHMLYLDREKRLERIVAETHKEKRIVIVIS